MKNKTLFSMALICSLWATWPSDAAAYVTCQKVVGKQEYKCSESVHLALTQYNWSLNPSYLGWLRYPTDGSNYKHRRDMVCKAFGDATVGGFSLQDGQLILNGEIYIVVRTGYVKVVRTYGAFGSNASQTSSEAKVSCSGIALGPVINAGLERPPEYPNTSLSALASIATPLCGGRGGTMVFGIGSVTVYCGGGGF